MEKQEVEGQFLWVDIVVVGSHNDHSPSYASRGPIQTYLYAEMLISYYVSKPRMPFLSYGSSQWPRPRLCKWPAEEKTLLQDKSLVSSLYRLISMPAVVQ